MTAAWIMYSAAISASGYILTWTEHFDAKGYILATSAAILLALWPVLNSLRQGLAFGRFSFTKIKRRPFQLIYAACGVIILVGGAIYPPTNYDAFCYRIPRVLQWLQAGQYHWIGGFTTRMDFSSLGFEWLMLPGIAIFHTLRFAFLNNAISFLLFPALLYSTMTRLGVRKAVASKWMWIIPCASCFVTEAGSIGNDFTATIYLLAAVHFALKAYDHGKKADVLLSILAAALCTSAKASNLPLVLPIAICLSCALWKYRSLILPAFITSVLALSISFLPLAIINIQHTGHWSGSPNSLQNIKNPVSGLLGNSLQIGVASLVPAVFPMSSQLNRWTSRLKNTEAIKSVIKDFPEINLSTLELASEEGSGLGLGVTSCLLLSFIFTRRKLKIPDPRSMEAWVCMAFWISLLVVMAKLGNPSVPRIIACYYPVILILPLAMVSSQRTVNNKYWNTASFILLLPIVPALAINPARPMVRLDRILELVGTRHESPLYKRTNVVYEVYSKRSDEHRALRELLPPNAKNIGFAGTDGDSQYSFWLPLGTRSVRDFTPTKDGSLPTTKGLDAIVTSDWGSDDRFGMTPEELANKIGWHIRASRDIRRMASFGEIRWSILTPTTVE